ncbi:MAG: hypothetical protein HRU34_07935 [Richelia sp.]|nr:hypothetical protein [Richelia sp.]
MTIKTYLTINYVQESLIFTTKLDALTLLFIYLLGLFMEPGVADDFPEDSLEVYDVDTMLSYLKSVKWGDKVKIMLLCIIKLEL